MTHRPKPVRHVVVSFFACRIAQHPGTQRQTPADAMRMTASLKPCGRGDHSRSTPDESQMYDAIS
jgi:hypothetical protein